MLWMLMGCAAISIAGCATSGDFCDVSSSIRPSRSDSLSLETQRQILAHNSYGAAACGWK